MKKTTTDYWQAWWDDCAKNAQSDFALNRCSTIRLDEREARAQKQFLADVDPQPADIVLDAGCGSGRNLSLLSGHVRQIVGMDFAPAMLERARERAELEKLANVELRQGSVIQLDFPNSYFDKVICASVLQYLDDRDCARALEELARVCKPNGILVLHIKNGTSLYALSLRLVRQIARLLGRKAKPERYRSLRWHTSVLEKLGGKIEHYDSFGILTFTPMPAWLLGHVAKFELNHLTESRLRSYGVNLQMKVRLHKGQLTQ